MPERHVTVWLKSVQLERIDDNVYVDCECPECGEFWEEEEPAYLEASEPSWNAVLEAAGRQGLDLFRPFKVEARRDYVDFWQESEKLTFKAGPTLAPSSATHDL